MFCGRICFFGTWIIGNNPEHWQIFIYHFIPFFPKSINGGSFFSLLLLRTWSAKKDQEFFLWLVVMHLCGWIRCFLCIENTQTTFLFPKLFQATLVNMFMLYELPRISTRHRSLSAAILITSESLLKNFIYVSNSYWSYLCILCIMAASSPFSGYDLLAFFHNVFSRCDF